MTVNYKDTKTWVYVGVVAFFFLLAFMILSSNQLTVLTTDEAKPDEAKPVETHEATPA